MAVIATSAPQKQESESRVPVSLTFIRMFRVLRLVRIIRVVRILRLIKELRTMVHSIMNTFSSLLWTLVLLLLLIYVVAVCCTQVMADAIQDDPSVVAGMDAHLYYGSLDRSILSLYQAITGGLNWRDALTPLTDKVSPLLALPYAMFIAFVVFAMLNVITGIFVESAVSNAIEENTVDLVHSLRDAVESMKDEGTELLTWQKFKCQIHTPSMLAYFQSINLDPCEAEHLFKLLDPQDSGAIDAEEFVMGCLRLHGTAKAIDLTTLMCEVRWLGLKWKEHAKFVEAFLLHTRHSGGSGKSRTPSGKSNYGESPAWPMPAQAGHREIGTPCIQPRNESLAAPSGDEAKLVLQI